MEGPDIKDVSLPTGESYQSFVLESTYNVFCHLIWRTRYGDNELNFSINDCSAQHENPSADYLFPPVNKHRSIK